MTVTPSLSRNALAGVLQVLGTGVALFLLYRYLARELGAGAIGLWALLLAGVNVTRLGEYGVSAGVVRFVARDSGAERFSDAKQIVFRAVALVAVAMAAMLGVAWFFADDLLRSSLGVGSNLDAAIALVPYAVVSVWVASIAAVMLGGIDGSRRIDIRAGIVVVASFAQLVFTWTFVPRFGLVAVAVGHLFQSALTLVAGVVAVNLLLPGDSRREPFWSWPRFVELLRFGGTMQFAAVAQVIFDPLARGLISNYGGLASTGHFEMANRFVMQVRSLVVAGYQSLIPHVAAGDADAGRIRILYRDSYSLMVSLLIVISSCLLAAMPVIELLWFKAGEPEFLAMGVIATVSWMLASLIAPAYYILLGMGRLFWPVTTQIATVVLLLALGPVFGGAYGGVGVAVAVALALVLASFSCLAGFHRLIGMPLLEAVPRAGLSGYTIVALGAMVLLISHGTRETQFHTAIAVAGTVVAVFSSTIWLLRREPRLWSLLTAIARRRMT